MLSREDCSELAGLDLGGFAKELDELNLDLDARRGLLNCSNRIACVEKLVVHLISSRNEKRTKFSSLGW